MLQGISDLLQRNTKKKVFKQAHEHLILQQSLEEYFNQNPDLKTLAQGLTLSQKNIDNFVEICIKSNNTALLTYLKTDITNLESIFTLKLNENLLLSPGQKIKVKFKSA